MPTKNVNGVELFYEESGSGEPIIFHHGYTGSHDSWDGVVERLQDRFRCVVMDGRGAGDSAHPDDGYTIEQMAADVVGMADALGIDRFTYVGHSMGGVMGMELGLSHAERLAKLVLVAPAPADGIEGLEEYHAHGRRLWLERARDSLISERIASTARESAHATVPAGVDRALSVSEGHYDGCWDALVGYHKGESLQGITTPTLMVAGAADSLLPANLLDFQRLPNATLHVFSRVSHSVPREVAPAFARVLADFMEHGVVTSTTLLEALRAAVR